MPYTTFASKFLFPIDITGATATKLDNIKFSYKTAAKNITNNGHTIQVNMHKGSRISVDGKTYNLLQFHFLSPSEHTVNGKPGAMVAHFVHQAGDGQLGVVGVLIKEGNSNPVIDQLWKNMPKHAKDTSKLTSKIKVAKLLPADRTYYNYSGSLTPPPCSEGVNWMVLKSQVEVSAAQVNSFTDLFARSVRPVQPQNGRVIKSSN